MTSQGNRPARINPAVADVSNSTYNAFPNHIRVDDQGRLWCIGSYGTGDNQSEMYISEDNGATWTAVTALRYVNRANYGNAFAFDSRGGIVVTGSNTGNIYWNSAGTAFPVANATASSGGADVYTYGMGSVYNTVTGTDWAIAYGENIISSNHGVIAYKREAAANQYSYYSTTQGQGGAGIDGPSANSYEHDGDFRTTSNTLTHFYNVQQNSTTAYLYHSAFNASVWTTSFTNLLSWSADNGARSIWINGFLYVLQTLNNTSFTMSKIGLSEGVITQTRAEVDTVPDLNALLGYTVGIAYQRVFLVTGRGYGANGDLYVVFVNTSSPNGSAAAPFYSVYEMRYDMATDTFDTSSLEMVFDPHTDIPEFAGNPYDVTGQLTVSSENDNEYHMKANLRREDNTALYEDWYLGSRVFNTPPTAPAFDREIP